MKKSALAISVLSLAMLSGAASATVNDTNLGANNVRFLGTVSQITCNLVPHVNGSATNVVNVGVVSTGTGTAHTQGTKIPFTLKPDNKNTNADAGCPAITDSTQANISFMGALDSNGLNNQSGTATDSYVAIVATNADDNSTVVTQGKNVRVVAGKALKEQGAMFTAQLFGGQTAGSYESAIAYQVQYQ
ncbi:fimbrial protein PefA [Salmonella enterica]|uniref:Fimbrial protein PefA n=1 Tax=Salmonella oranienberg TaxID=28147 RepID=A0A5W8FZR2_SALON|nr:fimbrial protein PefA [Salmonella enterica]EBR9087217.1 fimbrial protein PefA [Salmonella enterica subsp. enterica serovar Oranienburg]EBY0600987.1 fimbrial protein PefA [Salmonella enterica subsp. enterica serovar Oranienburg]EBZ4618640.1 fimbrial protein PefA [Salmonella enterica subsp. enterica serovar Oranienburg]ECJ9934500.1 fimbrial protein PefA [Salmonella enterica]